VPPQEFRVGVPVRVRDEVYRNLYLTDRMDGSEFTQEEVRPQMEF